MNNIIGGFVVLLSSMIQGSIYSKYKAYSLEVLSKIRLSSVISGKNILTIFLFMILEIVGIVSLFRISGGQGFLSVIVSMIVVIKSRSFFISKSGF